MAQAGSAQREPSMEEILASIRKIIEETDHARDEAPAAMPEEPAPESPAAAAVRPAAPQPAPEADISAFRKAIADIRDDDDAGHAGPEVAGDDGAKLTLAEVQRRLVREGEAGPAAAASGDMEDDGFVDDMTPALAVDDELAQGEHVRPLGTGRLDVPDRAEEPAGERAAAQDDVTRPAAADAGAPAAAGQRPALLSPNVGRQVAGSFDELKEAFMASRQKSFDEMAQEMLRPMLQDWLDNNLPVLVERLVREEIERIARG